MKKRVRIGIIGDYDTGKPSHTATLAALGHATEALGISADITWHPTLSLPGPAGLAGLEPADAIWGSPGSPYRSFEGALAGIRYARERGKPFIAT
jgi:CTP synthase (UTP-ammonia lyase)